MAALRNAFYVGQYKKVLVDAKNQKENAAAADVLFYRAMIALGAEEQCVKAIGGAQAPELQALKMYATYRSANDDAKELVLEKLKDLCKEQWTPDATTPATVQLCAALMWFESRNYKEALRLVHKGHENLEHLALAVQIYIRIDRLELAAKTVKAMQDVDDDDALTALASVWLYLAVGGDKAQEAFHLLEELVEKFQPSIALLNLMATCKIAAKEYAAAFQYTRQAKELAVANKEKISAETLSNTVVCMQHLHKPQIVAQVTAELKAAHPSNAWLQRQQAMESVFDKLAVQYAAGTTGIPAPAAGAGAASPVAAAGAGAAAAAKK